MRFALVFAFVAVAGCHHDDTFVANCSAGAPPAEASLPPSHPTATSAILPGGRAVTPAGTLLAMGGFPIALKLLPGDRYAVVTDDAEDDQALRVVDLKAADPLNAVGAIRIDPEDPVRDATAQRLSKHGTLVIFCA